ncbi:MAG: hypothetical protein K1X28_07085 [Parachlamydiales bacterium]|nr:hypothetical protein [Parachlamydiales bacterium]
MKKFTLLCILLFSMANANDLYLQARGAYFYPTSHRFREYHSGSGIYGLQFDYQIYKYLSGWAGADYYRQKGHTQGLHNSAHIDIVRYSLGVKFLYDKYCIKPYAGIGPAVVWVHTHVDSPYLIRSASKYGVGALAKTGAFIMLRRSFFIDLYIDYLWQTMNIHGHSHKFVVKHKADVSGFSFGAGIGYGF